MKLRLKSDSLRFRLGPSEVESLVAGATVEESVTITADDRLIYSIAIADREPNVTFTDGHIGVRLPSEVILTWANSDRIAIEVKQSIGGNRHLSVSIEKDFACMHGEEKNDDVFPNPLQNLGAKKV